MLAAIGGFAAIAGPIVRTTEPASSPVSAHDLTLDLDIWTDPIETKVDKPLLHDVRYSSQARVRGILHSAVASKNAKDFRFRVRTLSRPDHVESADCGKIEPSPMPNPIPDPNCYFVVDLSPENVDQGVEVTVLAPDKDLPVFTHIFRFETRTSYSLGLWDALMSV